MDNIPKIECKTVEIIKSKKTGKTYNTMEEFLKENAIEDLQKDLHSISSDISIDIDISNIFEKSGYRPVNVPYQEYYSDTIKEMVEEHCIQEISLFNYSF